MEEKVELLIFLFLTTLSLSTFLTIIKLVGVPITWYAAMLPILTSIGIISFMALIGVIVGIVISIQNIMRG